MGKMSLGEVIKSFMPPKSHTYEVMDQDPNPDISDSQVRSLNCSDYLVSASSTIL